MGLKSLIIRTAAITLAGIITVCALIFGCVAIFSPVTMASFFESIGSYSASITFYERQYALTKNIVDLSVLVVKIDSENDSVRAETYYKDFVTHKDYQAYCVVADQQEEKVLVTSDEYYRGKYAVVLVTNGKYSQAEMLCSSFVSENGYTAHNPFRTMISFVKDDLTQDELQSLKFKLNTLMATATSEQQELIALDLAKL